MHEQGGEQDQQAAPGMDKQSQAGGWSDLLVAPAACMAIHVGGAGRSGTDGDPAPSEGK